ncbi:MAG: T9SS type B sorting domain-containing protein [Paludibacteraceae bacterium]|nr:T9SS type B sorting domain-containing protein [Paludibacteraceae bacterium]
MKKQLYTSLLLLFGVVTGVFSQSMIITGGNDHGLALCSKGQIYAWGYNDGNRLCLAAPNDGLSIASSPCLVNTGGLTFSQLSGGSGGHSVALSCFKVVYCWGGNDNMQCGRPKSDYITGGVPVPVYHGEAPGYTEDGQPGGDYLGNVKYISATTAASVAILNDGTGRVVIWGGNLDGGGGVIETPSYEPVFIRDAQGQPIKNVIHITGGDNNILMIVGDSPDAKVGTVYSIGNWNGRGGGLTATSFIAAPVEIGDGTGKKSSGKHLDGVRNCGISDVGAFAVDGATGYVYGWGNGGWGCSNGLANNQTTTYAEKVISGEYEAKSGDAYLTDVTQVIGGNGFGAAVTQEGYLLYWGCNDAANGTTRSGGVVPNSTYAAASDMCKTGPVYANYCKGEKGASEVRVDDAVAIARGDLYGFMVNKDGDFYTWGSTARPGNVMPDHVGALGIGKEKYVSTCLTKINIQCTPQDLCPEAFMIGPRYKCPGVATSLYSGFSPTTGSEDAYFYLWLKDGDTLNTSRPKSTLTERKADIYNKDEIDASEPGLYRVEIMYIGLNVPCDNCPETFAEIEVIDMEMPIDTVVKTSCVATPLSPTATDVICYEFNVNNKFYKLNQETTWEVYASETGGSALDTIDVKAGGKGSFCVDGSKVTVNDNKPVDTTYSIWLEDVTKQQMHIYKDKKTTSSGSFQSYGLMLECWSDAQLSSFDLVLKSYSGEATATVTPTIYKVALNAQGQYVVGSVYKTGTKQTVTFDDTETTVTVDCGDILLEGNSTRGARYVLGMTFTGNCNMYLFGVTHEQNVPNFTTPVPDDLTGTAVLAIGATANQYNSMSNPSDYCPYVNVTFDKLTDYNCGRIELQSKYWCPPCNQPDPFDIEVTGATPSNDTIYLCEESDKVTLSVSSVKKAADNTAFFDELWFLDKVGADADALQTDTKKQATTLNQPIVWTAAKEGTTEKYYVKIRDNEKPDAAACYVFDSIIVKYNKKPIAPDIDDIAICENASATEKQALTNALASADFNGLTVTWYSDDAKTTKTSEPDLSTLTKSDKTYYYDVMDDATGCYSNVNSVQITVYGVPADPVAAIDPFCVGDNVSLVQTSPVEGYEVIWYDESDAQLTSNSLATLTGKDYTYHYVLKSPAPENCLSDKIAYPFTVQNYTSVVLDTTMICGQTTMTTSSLTPSTASITWALEGAVVATPTFTTASGKVGNIGTVSATVKQTGYCDKTFEMENVYVKDIPSKPTGELKVTYLKTDAVNNVFKNLLEQNPNAVKEETGYTLQWYDASGNKLSSCPVPPYPAATETEDKFYTYKVSRINADGCESETETVNVTVYLTPAPTTTDISYCLNSPNVAPLTAQINDPNNVGGFSLQWYDLNNQKVASITPDVSVAGKTTYHVTQVSSDGAESSPADLTVTVYEVLEPTLSAANEYEYCADQSTVSLEASLNSDNDIHPASDLVWSKKDENGDYIVVPNSNFSLDVTATTTYQYAVHQTYTTTSNEVCVGPKVEKEVKVTYVPPVVTHEVLYLKASANADGTFSKNLLEQNPSAVEYTSGATLVWYESDCLTKVTTGTPSPKVDPTVPEGSEQNESYCVSQIIDGCESTPTPIAVRISDALPPTPYTYHYCEGATMEDLKADINKLTATSQYELYWYGEQEPATTSASDNVIKGDTYPMNGKVATLNGTGVTTLKYWVAQHDLSTDAVSSAQPVIINIYPQPVVSIDDPAPVCEENVNLAMGASVSNVSYNVSYHYYKDGVEMVGTSTAIMSGKYSVSAEYTLPATASSTVIVNNNGVCAGPQKEVNVVINDLTVPEILGFYTTCPGTSVTLHATASSTDPGSDAITYAWTSDPASAIASAQADSMVTTTLSTEPGTKYKFSVTATAGACVKSIPTGSEHDVTIGNGQVKGTMTLQEDENYNGEKFLFSNDMERRFLSCGRPVNIKVDYTTTEGTYTWYKNGQPWKTGSEVTTDALDMDSEDIYTVEFINQCKATAAVTIETVPLSASPISQDLVELCEGVPFTTSFTYKLRAGLTPAITWYHEGHEIGGQTDPVMVLNNTKDEDDGVYSYTIQNNGCIVEGVANTLNVKPYIRATIQSEPFVVDRHQTATLPITFAVPSNGSQNIEWNEGGQKVYDKNPFIVTDVTADHEYDIYLTDPEYCGDTLHATLYVDAELQLKTEMKDVICLGNSAVLKIDTTGTGKFRNPNSNPVLDISYVENGITHSLVDKIRKNGDTLEVTVSPEIDTEYQITFSYTSQMRHQELISKEQIEVIPAISLTTPAVPNVCEGGEAVLEVKDVSPEGTTVSWKADPTILSGENTTTIRVQPTFAGGAQPFEGGANYQSLYTYTAIAYNDFCQTSVEYAVPVIVDQPLSGDITGITEICEGFEASFDASSYKASTYTWTPDTLGLPSRATQTVKPTQSTQYMVDMTRGLCSASDTFIVTVHTNPVIESIDSIALRDRQIVLAQDRGEAPFLYGIDVQPADGNDIKTNLTFSKHVVNVTDRYGCKTTGSFRLDPPAIVIPELVTDNGDGVNDVWLIPNLADVYPNAIVSIYDRFGKLLAQFLGADSDGWDCTYMGRKLPSTDYWYQITIEEINKEYTGHFTLIRR